MKLYSALIVDDERYARRRIRNLLSRDGQIDRIGECANVTDALAAIRKTSPDILFLDIQMPERDGFEVLSELTPDKRPVVVFVTAYDRYALKAFEAEALDYLLKPFDNKRFATVLERAKTAVGNRSTLEAAQEMAAVLTRLAEGQADAASRVPNAYPKRLAVKSASRVTFVRVEDIEWIKAAGNYSELRAEGRTHLMRKGIGELEEELDPESFLRIHRSIILNVERIREVHATSNGEYVFIVSDGSRLASSRSYLKQVKRLLEGRPPAASGRSSIR